MLTDLVALEVGVLDDAEQVAERVAHGRDLDAAADVFHRFMDLCPQARQAGKLRRRVRDASVRLHAGGARLAVGDQPQLEAADREPDVKRLVEIRVAPEYLTIPLLALGKVRRGIDGSPQP